MLFAKEWGKSMWYPLHQAAMRWNEVRLEARGVWLKTRDDAAAENKYGDKCPQRRDEDGILLHPFEDDLPFKEESESEE